MACKTAINPVQTATESVNIWLKIGTTKTNYHDPNAETLQA